MKKIKSRIQAEFQEFDGPATMEVRIQYESGSITTATYLLPDLLMAESVFENTCKTARTLSDAALQLYGTDAYKQLRPHSLRKRGEK